MFVLFPTGQHIDKWLWEPHIVQLKRVRKQWGNLFISKAGNATSNPGHIECSPGTRAAPPAWLPARLLPNTNTSSLSSEVIFSGVYFNCILMLITVLLIVRWDLRPETGAADKLVYWNLGIFRGITKQLAVINFFLSCLKYQSEDSSASRDIN